MKDRIFELIDALGVTAGAFADEIGIERSTMTHIKNERSKPSLELVQKIKKRYGNVSTDWLIFGHGTMFLHSGDSQTTDLFSQTPITLENSQRYASNNSQNRDNEFEAFSDSTLRLSEQQPEIAAPSLKHTKNETFTVPAPIESRKAIRVIIFYDDNSFEELKQ